MDRTMTGLRVTQVYECRAELREMCGDCCGLLFCVSCRS